MKINSALACTIIATVIFSGYATTTSASTITGTVAKSTATTPLIAEAAGNTLTEKDVRNFFKDTPVMIEIARCESNFRQYTDNGNPLRSSGMIGVFQFYESIHAPGAKALGFDLTTTSGNLSYAKHIYNTEGTRPWNGSRFCWESVAASTAETNLIISDTVRREKLLEQINTLIELITLLQKQLDAEKQHSK